MTLKLNRRLFGAATLRGATGIAIGTQLPLIWQQPGLMAAESEQSERILVVIQLSGGNDGLNTVVPYANEKYYKARPKLAIPRENVVRLDDSLGLHPSLKSLESLLSEKRFSIIQGVGYENPNRSHFESMDIWHTCARKQTRSNEGWLGRMFAASKVAQSDSPGLHLGSEVLPLALSARGVQIPSIASVEEMRLKLGNQPKQNQAMDERPAVDKKNANQGAANLLDFVSTSTAVALQASQRLEQVLAPADTSSDFPDSLLGEKLKVVSRLIVAGLKTRVYYVTLDGFDTHANQPVAHQSLLTQWSEALSAFHRRLSRDGQSDRVLVMTFSEFGRRLAENASDGTDHGAAAPVFFSGPKLANWQVGKLPSLDDLDDGDIKYHTDFRRVYATVLQEWLAQPTQVPLAGTFEPLKDAFVSRA
jgi:uncharacterized protein (DUF1501 family)